MALKHLLLCLLPLACVRGQLNTSASSSSFTSAYTTANGVTYCGDRCQLVAHEVVHFDWPYNSTLVADYVTQVINVGKDGNTTQTITDTSASQEFSSSLNYLLSSLAPKFGEQELFTINVSAGTGPLTAQMLAEFDYINYATVTVIDDTPTCVATGEQLSGLLPNDWTVPLSYVQTFDNWQGPVIPSFLLSSAFSSAGILLPPNCSQNNPGDAIGQVPVQYLTQTSVRAYPAAFSPTSAQLPASEPAAPASTVPTAIPQTSPCRPQTSTTTAPAPNSVSTPISSPTSRSYIVIASQTLLPGSEIIISGTAISLDPSASAVVVGSDTIALAATATPSNNPVNVITIASSTYTANSAFDFEIGSQTLTPGGQIVAGGTTIYLASNGATLVVGTSTQVASNAGLGAAIWSAFNSQSVSSTAESSGASTGSATSNTVTTGDATRGYSARTLAVGFVLLASILLAD